MKVLLQLCFLFVLLCSFFLLSCFNERVSDISENQLPEEHRSETPVPTEPPTLEDQLASDELFIEYMDAVISLNMKFTAKVKDLNESQIEDYLEDLEDLAENMTEDDEEEVIEKMGFDDTDDYDTVIDNMRYYRNALFQKYAALSTMTVEQRAILYRSVLVRVEVKAIFIARFAAGVFGGFYDDCWFICFWWESYVYIFVEIIIDIEAEECMFITTPHWQLLRCIALRQVIIVQNEYESYWSFIFCIYSCPTDTSTPTPIPTPEITSVP